MPRTTQPGRGVSFDAATPAVVIDQLSVTHPAVCSEALRWSTGKRGAAVGADVMVGADLTDFVTQALAVGAQAIATAGGTQDTFDLERLVAEVGTRTTEASAKAAAATSETVKEVAEAITKVSEATQKVIADASESARKTYADNVETANKTMIAKVQELLGGENPELLQKLTPVLEAVGQKMGDHAFEQTDRLLTKVSRQFDPADPTSPFAKQAKTLQEQQAALTSVMDKNHLALATKFEELATAVHVTTAAKKAAADLAKVTPLKGDSYAAGIHTVMEEIAAGLGDEYVDSGTAVGALSRSKKGDGVLTVCGGQARVVLEMTDSARTGWNAYLEEAERNRDAAASLGLIRQVSRNGGHTIRVLGPRRMVMAFDPATDDLDLLRTVVLLLRVGALAASSRQDLEGIQTAQERLDEAITVLAGLDDIVKTAGSIHKSADKISDRGEHLKTTLTRILSQAMTALEGASAAPGAETSTVCDTESVSPGSSDAA